MAAASSHTHKYSNVSNQDSDQEPIYQNQAELRQQLQMLDNRGEPIYQNLPAHEKLMLLQQEKTQHQQVISQTKLPEKADIMEDNNEDDEAASSTSTTKIKGHVSRVAITNSREDLSSSNQQHTEYITNPALQIQSPVSPETASAIPNNIDTLDNNRKKSVTKINIGTILPGPELSIHDNNLLQQQQAQPYSKQKATEPTTIKTAQVSKVQQQQKTRQNTKAIVENLPGTGTTPSDPENINSATGQLSSAPKVKSPPKKPVRAKASQSVENITTISDETTLDNTVNSGGHLTPSSKANTIHTPRTPSSKPRAGRKRWAFNFGGSKTGSLKSLKSIKSSGENDDEEKK